MDVDGQQDQQKVQQEEDKKTQEQEIIMCDDEFTNQAGMGHTLPMDEKFSTTQPYHNGRKLLVLMKTSQCVSFKAILECLKELLTEVNMEFIENRGIRIVSLDPGKIAMVHLLINDVEYFFAKGTIVAGINMSFLYRVIRSISSNELMEWMIFEDDPNVMHIVLSNNERRTSTINKIKLLDLDEMEISIPRVEFDRVVSMPSTDLAKHIREVVTISNFVTIRGTKTTLEFIANGEQASSHITIKPTASGLNWKYSDEVEEISGTFVARYLEKFCRCSVDTNVELFLKNDYPLILRYELSIGTLRFCVAPVAATQE